MNAPDQRTLFQCQKWHLKIALRNEVWLRKHDKWLRAAGKRAIGPIAREIRAQRRDAQRRAKFHRRFVDCITPFVRLPI